MYCNIIWKKRHVKEIYVLKVLNNIHENVFVSIICTYPCSQNKCSTIWVQLFSPSEHKRQWTTGVSVSMCFALKWFTLLPLWKAVIKLLYNSAASVTLYIVPTSNELLPPQSVSEIEFCNWFICTFLSLSHLIFFLVIKISRMLANIYIFKKWNWSGYLIVVYILILLLWNKKFRYEKYDAQTVFLSRV